MHAGRRADFFCGVYQLETRFARKIDNSTSIRVYISHLVIHALSPTPAYYINSINGRCENSVVLIVQSPDACGCGTNDTWLYSYQVCDIPLEYIFKVIQSTAGSVWAINVFFYIVAVPVCTAAIIPCCWKIPKAPRRRRGSAFFHQPDKP